MKATIFLKGATLVLLLTAFGANVQRNSLSKIKAYTVSGRVQQQFPYCGGARPTPEMLTKAATPVAYPNKTFYVKAGKTNSLSGKLIAQFTTNDEGLYTLSLLSGIYSIIVKEQLNTINLNVYSTENQKIDEKCLADWWKKPYYLLEVKDRNISSLDFTFVHRCFLTNDIPCVRYTGPMPH